MIESAHAKLKGWASGHTGRKGNKMKKNEIKKVLLENINFWGVKEKESEAAAHEYLKRGNMIRQNREFENSCRYMSMRNALAILGKELEIFTEEEYQKIMEP